MSGLYKFFPIASDKMGYLWTVSSIKDAYIIEYGPGGTTHYSIEGMFKINGQMAANLYTTHMSQDDVIMGDMSRLRNSICEVDEIHRPKYIFVMGSSLAGVIGSDIKGLAFELRNEINAKLILHASGGFKGDYVSGIEQALSDIATEIVQELDTRDENSYNLIGCTMGDYNFKADTIAIKEVLKESLDLHCNCVFTYDTSIEQLERASKAKLNIVLKEEGLKCAEILKERFGMEYVCVNPIGYKNTFKMISEVGNYFNISPNTDYIAKRKAESRANLMTIRSYLRVRPEKSTLISGDYAAVTGYEKFFVDEIGLDVKSVLVNHAKNFEGAVSDKYIFKATEQTKVAEIERIEAKFVIGDAVLCYFAENAKVKFQIQNPNIQKKIITAHMPLMCFKGADHIIEEIINIL